MYKGQLLQSLPRTEEEKALVKQAMAENLPVEAGCEYQHKCRHTLKACKKERPQAIPVTESHTVCCHLYAEEDVYKRQALRWARARGATGEGFRKNKKRQNGFFKDLFCLFIK